MSNTLKSQFYFGESDVWGTHYTTYMKQNNPIQPVVNGKVGYEHVSDNDSNNWYDLVLNLSVIKFNNSYFYFKNGQWMSFEELNKDNMENLGFSIFNISDSDIRSLVDNDEFEIINWTDETNANRRLISSLVPKNQLIQSDLSVSGKMSNIESFDIDTSYLVSSDKINWYTWDGFGFVKFEDGMNYISSSILNSMTLNDWEKWDSNTTYIASILSENSLFENIKISTSKPLHTHEVEKANFYILNTVARIDIKFTSNQLIGQLSDADLGRVQYRVFLNGKPYFPIDGEFTQLAPSPQNIELKIQTKDIVVGDWNNIKVEFRDFFGTIDYWSTNFIGAYSGLLFKDIHGDLYSSDVGEILKHLDFGTIIAGQTTVEHEVILSNNYGFDIENIKLYVNNHTFPDGMVCEFSKSNAPFFPQSELQYSNTLINGDELSFFVRLKSILGATPDSDGEFEIKVTARKIE